MRLDQPVREQVQPQVRVGGVLRRVGERLDRHRDPAVRQARQGAGPIVPGAAAAAASAGQHAGAGSGAAAGRAPRLSRRGNQASSTWPVVGARVARPRSPGGRSRCSVMAGQATGSLRPWRARCTPTLLADPVALTRALVDIESVSGNEKQIADRVEEALRRPTHLKGGADRQRDRPAPSWAAPQRVVLAGHLDTVPLARQLPVHGRGRLMYGCGTRT